MFCKIIDAKGEDIAMDHYLLMGAAVLVILAAAYIALYNRLQRLRVKVEEALALMWRWKSGST